MRLTLYDMSPKNALKTVAGIAILFIQGYSFQGPVEPGPQGDGMTLYVIVMFLLGIWLFLSGIIDHLKAVENSKKNNMEQQESPQKEKDWFGRVFVAGCLIGIIVYLLGFHALAAVMGFSLIGLSASFANR